MYYNSITELIGKTPLVKLNNLEKEQDLQAHLFAKVEFFNPGGSIKDRIAKAMIEVAEASGKLNKDTTIYEPTSGNTGIGAALMGAARGYKVVIVMPESVSIERRKIVRAFGAEVVLTEGPLGMKGAIAKVQEFLAEDDNAITLSQFENEANPAEHNVSTAIEIYDDLDGKVDVVISGVGTGGTITGVGHYLKDKNPNIEIIAVEPEKSAVLSGKEPSPHKIQGIGAGFVPNVLDTKVYDRIMTVSEEDAINCARLIASKEGIFAGISAGAALSAALEVAKDEKYKGKNVVVILPDTGERYLSTEAFA